MYSPARVKAQAKAQAKASKKPSLEGQLLGPCERKHEGQNGLEKKKLRLRLFREVWRQGHVVILGNFAKRPDQNLADVRWAAFGLFVVVYFRS